MYDVTCEDIAAQRYLTLSESVPREQVGGFLGRAYPVLFGALGTLGVPASGPPIARYRVDETAFHVTAGVPFDADFEAQAPMVVETVPALTIATTVHKGSYEGLPAAFHAVIEWIGANAYQITGDPWECYLDGPEVSEPRTKVCFPVAAQ